jgi:hypothetical protein
LTQKIICRRKMTHKWSANKFLVCFQNLSCLFL